jgi:hypothetical protein
MKRLLIFISLALLFLFWITCEIRDVDSKLKGRATGFMGSLSLTLEE